MTVWKSVLLVLVILVVMIGLVTFISYQAQVPSILQQEQIDVQQNLFRSAKMVDDGLNDLYIQGPEWAFWDDTYEFAQNPSLEFVSTWLYSAEFKDMNVNVIYISRLSGETLFSKAYDLTKMEEIDLPSDFSEQFASGSPLVRKIISKKGISGLLPLKEVTLSVAAFPILPDTGEGDPAGILVLGRFTNLDLDSSQIAAGGARLEVVNSNMALNGNPLLTQIQQMNASHKDQLMAATNNDTISGFQIIKDIYGNPSTLVKLDQPRIMFSNWIRMVITLDFVVAFVIIAFWLLMDIFFRRLNYAQKQQAQAERQFRQSEEKYQTVSEAVPDILWEVNASGTYTYLNSRVRDILGFEPRELIGRNSMELGDHSDHLGHGNLRNLLIQGKPVYGLLNTFRHKNGTEVILESNSLPAFDQNGNLSCIRGIDRDVTEREATAALIKQVEARYRQLVEQINAVTYTRLFENENRYFFTFMSPQIEKLLGYKSDDLIQKNNSWVPLIHPDDRSRVQAESLHSLVSNENFSGEYRMLTLDGRTIWVHEEAALSNELGQKPGVWHGVIYDITIRKGMEEDLRYISSHDAMTGAYNRGYFNHSLELLQNSSQFPISIIVCDLDNLKTINDHQGHAAGDRLICNTVALLQKCFRPEDIIARTGGDEFVILFPKTDEKTIGSVATRLDAEIYTYNSSHSDAPIQISVGAATGNEGATLDVIFNLADSRMYAQKQIRKKSSSLSSSKA
jgi:diguanylate cyclase (GGDEF)-like protein/PAS domain S-box-containing protein